MFEIVTMVTASAVPHSQDQWNRDTKFWPPTSTSVHGGSQGTSDRTQVTMPGVRHSSSSANTMKLPRSSVARSHSSPKSTRPGVAEDALRAEAKLRAVARAEARADARAVEARAHIGRQAKGASLVATGPQPFLGNGSQGTHEQGFSFNPGRRQPSASAKAAGHVHETAQTKASDHQSSHYVALDAGAVSESAGVPSPLSTNSVFFPEPSKSDRVRRRVSECKLSECSPMARSPASCKSTGSAAEYNRPEQTIIIFDWDDTLCPSTNCLREIGMSPDLPPPREVAVALQKHATAVSALLREAQDRSAYVVIVTNAEKGWVERSCKSWMPQVLPALEDCDVISARSQWEPRGVRSPTGWKAQAFNEAISRFYSRYRQQSWKNVVSVGDARYEHDALQRVMGSVEGTKCRFKTVKFLERPNIVQLTLQIRFLKQGLNDIVEENSDLDLHFSPDLLPH